MASKIEDFLFGEKSTNVSDTGAVGDHCISSFLVTEEHLDLVIMPWDCPAQAKHVRFPAARMSQLRQVTDYPADIELPWEIRGIFCNDEAADGRWSFHMNTNGLRIGWVSEWPEVLS